MNSSEMEMLIDDFDNYLAEEEKANALTDKERELLRMFLLWEEQNRNVRR